MNEHVALISENAVFSFNSHRHGWVFGCFPDSLFFWRLTGNNHLTSATNWRFKVTGLMPGKKSINIEGVLRLRLGTPRNRFITLTSLWSFTKKYPLKVYGSLFKSPRLIQHDLSSKTWSLSIVSC